ncbi:bifunctional diaminohydroxyphosphoribosylaminopyrimidine deaminase/5-amino-6-(5-phosphoribosylamino)uracil reductase RibD [Patulibacter sp.]|uniref:bifunctional diaminohydroxyphosphoribosylaminopyrimidine deaminase/5-amino-6-(5-phosphoribosylamino)uracil reductase RibD n=1 Tax=Patulibacter sp. TaxID=1912859 RepID=UPI002724FCDC|nr:bifunctional diaminohydroxyphosphoribosylaminopyrimidine deaminase/5-amino-6-(5-phosphoribosylamino)uracil reductase RibD [Patulibacter sp.]MDO9409934.1 bifunctional diaminohydroxyphosphoribosylaminopyrimidine deaminase/5-amino-6-(5-phosphoribosylamino)uracil reductase RibD [Patulibacter sp.]
MTMDARDVALLERAVELAERGRRHVSPNPLVGAVVSRDGQVLGEGWHAELGGPHAEVQAIAACGEQDLTGATIHVSLEPCCHQGRTPPCTDAILAAGLARVVVASDDPSTKASGRGLGILRDEGVQVASAPADSPVGLRARRQNQPFRKHARTGLPWVMMKTATSLDGRLATHSGDSRWISSGPSRDLAHQWRAEVDAVVVGIGTALADDPQLTARVPGVARQPRRVVFDSEARLPLDGRLVASIDEAPVTLITSRAASRSATEALTASGVEVVVVSGQNEHSRVRSALAELGQRDVTSLMLEGGSHLAGAFFDAGEIDELRLFVAPLLLGGRQAPGLIGGEGVERIADAARPVELTRQAVGDDLLTIARLKEW